MSEIIGFLAANWPYILAYPFVGYTLGKISNKLFRDDTSTEKLGFLQKIPRLIFYPVSYYDWDERHDKHSKYTDFWDDTLRRFSLRAFAKGDKNLYCKILTTFWPFSEVFVFTTAVIANKIINKIINLTAKLPEKSYSLLQNGTRQIKLLAPGKNQDIKTVIGQIEEFRSTRLGSEKNKILAEQKAIEERLRIITGSLESWQIVVRKNANTTANISPVLESLAKEMESLASKKSNLCQLEGKLNVAEKNLSESVEILWRCLSTIPLNIPITVDGPGLIKQDYLATLAADTISQAETEMARIKDEVEKNARGGG